MFNEKKPPASERLLPILGRAGVDHYWTVTPPLPSSESTRARSSAWFFAGKSQAFK